VYASEPGHRLPGDAILINRVRHHPLHDPESGIDGEEVTRPTIADKEASKHHLRPWSSLRMSR
jgi:hypothetical protein